MGLLLFICINWQFLDFSRFFFLILNSIDFLRKTLKILCCSGDVVRVGYHFIAITSRFKSDSNTCLGLMYGLKKPVLNYSYSI